VIRFIGPMILAIVAVALLSGSAAGVAYVGGLLWERFGSESVCAMYGLGVSCAAFVAFMGGVTFVGRAMRDEG